MGDIIGLSESEKKKGQGKRTVFKKQNGAGNPASFVQGISGQDKIPVLCPVLWMFVLSAVQGAVEIEAEIFRNFCLTEYA